MKFILMLALSAIPMYAQTPQTPPKNSESWLKDQVDQTDTYAIPLDSSEEEERQELEELEKKSHRQKPVQGPSQKTKPKTY